MNLPLPQIIPTNTPVTLKISPQKSFSYFWAFTLICLVYACTDKQAPTTEDQFSKNVRTTAARTPAEEQAGFQLPAGFDIQLFAAEPDIGKPLNMAFDAKGRMWLTQSYEYPFADTTGTGKDRISILEDTDGDGQADTFTVFADSLNIPIGIVAVADGAIAYSIPHIYHFIDDNGDDQVDRRKVLLSGFEYKDTHGMINNLVRSWDGWIHADHGFSNTSRVAGTDGDSLVMFSGNTFRFRPDGSRIESTTTGRVNPFGYAYDEMGYTYSVDCHTSPIYQLVRGADYPHFGKQPTGIGFGPAMMQHTHGSTALAGLEYYLGTQFPEQYQQSFYMGDVVKSRVYRSTISMKGTTPVAHWEQDFVISEDPWFRPVDVKLGPDGALYIADFYNSIIGHYEVPLDHPGRDRQRGRIWRIVYQGEEQQGDIAVNDLSAAKLETLLKSLNNKNLPLRMSIADQIVDRFGKEAIQPIQAMLTATETEFSAYIQSLWILFRLQALPNELLATAIKHKDERVQVHALRIMFEYQTLDEPLQKLALAALAIPNPHIQRQATMVLAKNPKIEHLAPLLLLRQSVNQAEDSHFFYALRQGLRDHLRNDKVMQWVKGHRWEEQEARALADLMVGVDHIYAAQFLLKHIKTYDESEKQLIAYTTHTARYLPSSALNQLISITQKKTEKDPDLEYTLFKAIQEGLAQRGEAMPAKGKDWGIALAASFLSDDSSIKNQWRVIPNAYMPFAHNPWRLIDTTMGKSPEKISLLASGPMQEGRAISTLYTPSFSLPETLEYVLFGRKNKAKENEKPTLAVNQVELRLLKNDSIIATTYVEKPDTEQKVIWAIDTHAGQQVYLAVIDASRVLGEFIAIGQFRPEVLSLPSQSPSQLAEQQIFAAQIAKTFKATAFISSLEHLLLSETADVYARAAAAEALLELDPEKSLAQIAALLAKEQEPLILKEKISYAISELSSPKALITLEKALANLSYKAQKGIALNMTNTSAGIEQLLHAAGEVNISPRLLLERQIQQPLLAKMSPAQKQEFDRLTANIKPPSEGIQSLINARLQAFVDARPSLEKGSLVFTQYCAPCHQIKGQGGNIGPQMDGIGNWGQRALTEKILDPNRNISKAFTNYTLRLTDGKVRTGLFRREEGEMLIFANAAGQEFSIPKSEIQEQKVSPFTLMPDHFGQIIPEEEYHALLNYLLQEN